MRHMRRYRHAGTNLRSARAADRYSQLPRSVETYTSTHDARTPDGGALATTPTPRRLIVDGEVFEVRPSGNGQGFDFDWVSGPNPGYGFSSGIATTFVPGTEPVVASPEVDDQALKAQVRLFLEQIDPETGYIAD